MRCIPVFLCLKAEDIGHGALAEGLYRHAVHGSGMDPVMPEKAAQNLPQRPEFPVAALHGADFQISGQLFQRGKATLPAGEDIPLMVGIRADLPEIVVVYAFCVGIHLPGSSRHIPVKGLPTGKGGGILIRHGIIKRLKIRSRLQCESFEGFVFLPGQGCVFRTEKHIGIRIPYVQITGTVLRYLCGDRLRDENATPFQERGSLSRHFCHGFPKAFSTGVCSGKILRPEEGILPVMLPYTAHKHRKEQLLSRI